jgi:selenocysteine-specific elongation factor
MEEKHPGKDSHDDGDMVPSLNTQDALTIGSRFDMDASKAACRLAFYGRLAALIDPDDAVALSRLRIFKPKRKTGSVDRILGGDACTAVCKGMFKKETNISLFSGMRVGLLHLCC